MQSRNTRTCLRKRAHARKGRSADGTIHSCHTEFTSVDAADMRRSRAFGRVDGRDRRELSERPSSPAAAADETLNPKSLEAAAVRRSGLLGSWALWQSEVAPCVPLPASKLEHPDAESLNLRRRSAALRASLTLMMRGAIAMIADPLGDHLANSPNVLHCSTTCRTVHVCLPPQARRSTIT